MKADNLSHSQPDYSLNLNKRSRPIFLMFGHNCEFHSTNNMKAWISTQVYFINITRVKVEIYVKAKRESQVMWSLTHLWWPCISPDLLCPKSVLSQSYPLSVCFCEYYSQIGITQLNSQLFNLVYQNITLLQHALRSIGNKQQ